MATLMNLPLLGQTMEEGTIIRWMKQEGDAVKEGEPLLEVMTDKVNMEVESPASGVLRRILANVDDVVPVLAPIAIIGSADEPIDDLLPSASGSVASESAKEIEKPQTVTSQTTSVTEESTTSGQSEDRIIASPSAKRLASERGINIESLSGRGTGPGGRIVEKDVLDYIASVRSTPLAGKMAEETGVDLTGITGTGVSGRITSVDVSRAAWSMKPPLGISAIGETIPFTGLRKAIADNVAKSARETVPVTLVTEVDMTECVAVRRGIIDAVEKRDGVKLSITDFIVKAAAAAILEKPIVNSSLDGDRIVIHDRVNIGIATALEAGLVVPVVKDVVNKTLPQISREIKELVTRARENRASGDDFKGGTFTITNLGAYGIDVFNPVITPGQGAILGVCRIAEKPVALNGTVVVRSMMNLCLTFDHRIMDGAPAAEYLARLKSILEAPYILFI